jgi:hypothetical protein
VGCSFARRGLAQERNAERDTTALSQDTVFMCHLRN